MTTPTTSRRRAAAALATLALLAPALTACQDSSTSATVPEGTPVIHAVASTTQVCDHVTQLATDTTKDASTATPSAAGGLSLARTGADGTTRELGADPATASVRLELTCLLAPNASAHEHEMTAAQAKALAGADLFLVNGVDLEHFLDDAVTSTGFKGTMVVTSGVLTADDVDDPASTAAAADLPYTIERGAHTVEVAPWPFAPEPGEEAEFRYDPHVWTSPRNAAVQVENIGDALITALGDADAAATATLRAHVTTHLERLAALDQWASDSLSTVPADKRVLFTSHDAFGYLSKAYGIRFEGAAMSDFNAQQDATAQKIQATADAIKASGAVAVFAENSNNPRSIQKVAELAGVRAIIGDEALYGDSLGDPGSDGETYIGSLLHNVTNLTRAWGGTTAPVPDSLQPWAPTDVLSAGQAS